MNKENCKLLGIEEKKVYFELSNEYKKVFENYLLLKVDLLKYDNDIKNSKIGIGDLDKNIKLKSSLNEFLNLNHIFILNEFHIEKLNKDQIDILKGNDENEKKSLVINTFKEVIRNNYLNGKYENKTYKINYINSTGKAGIFDNDSLVIAIYYGKNKYKYGSKELYLKNYRERIDFLKELSFKIKRDVNVELDLKCDVITSRM